MYTSANMWKENGVFSVTYWTVVLKQKTTVCLYVAIVIRIDTGPILAFYKRVLKHISIFLNILSTQRDVVSLNIVTYLLLLLNRLGHKASNFHLYNALTTLAHVTAKAAPVLDFGLLLWDNFRRKCLNKQSVWSIFMYSRIFRESHLLILAANLCSRCSINTMLTIDRKAHKNKNGLRIFTILNPIRVEAKTFENVSVYTNIAQFELHNVSDTTYGPQNIVTSIILL